MHNNVVRFENVSKQYNLGVTRTSILTLLRNSVRHVVRPILRVSTEKQTLWALRDISFELEPGQSLGLIGKNGAGKSTLLKLLANITKPTMGEIEVSGRMSALLELGTGFHGDLTGRENIYLNGIILGLTRNEVEQRYDEIVAFSELERFIDTPVKRYSSGMLVRLGFAVAACIEPEILLVDEVLAVGDASFRQKCLNRIQSLIDNGTSIIFVSHNLSMVQAICPTSLYIVDGQIKHHGETKNIIDMYQRDLLVERAYEFEESLDRAEDVVNEVEITEIEILSASDINAEELHSEQPAQILIHYNVHQTANKASVMVRILRTDGFTCVNMSSYLDSFELSLHQDGGVVSVQLDPLQLITGTYVVEARILNESASLILASKISQWFYIAGKSRGHTEYFGVFEPRRSWEHKPADCILNDDRQDAEIERQPIG